VEVERSESGAVRWEVARRQPAPALHGLLARALEGWTREGAAAACFRELPFPGVPLILNLGTPWQVAETGGASETLDSFLAGLHTKPTAVAGERSFSCLELRLTPLGAHRLLRRPMHELAERTVALEELLPGASRLGDRLREARTWQTRFDLVESALVRRLADAPSPSREVAWAWRQLVASGGRVPVRELGRELEWSPRRLIARFREHVGLAPKAAARVIRFDRAVAALSAGAPRIAEVAAACGYADQAHLSREFRDLAGTTPARLREPAA
jgi:AraC-like DNA-binding protein